jgi:5-methylcytosine-specific restriction endonuclease McrA
MDLSARSDEDLLQGVATLTGSHRELTAKLVAHLGEIEERRLHLLRGFSSMFDFCTNELRFSEGEAFRRILAARLSRRFPVVLSLLASGGLNLSTLELLREWLTDENHRELFEAAVGKSKREVRALVAAHFPRPDRPSRIRRATIEPLSEARFVVEFTASEGLRQKLELCRDLMSHANPTRDLAVVIERAVDLWLARAKRPMRNGESLPGITNARGENPTKEPDSCDRMSFASTVGGVHTDRTVPSRVTRSARRKVFERDGLRCLYISENGRRCEARAFLELDHAVPKALSGSSDAGNLRVFCRAHNQLLAEQAFGREHIAWSRRFRQQKSTSARWPEAATTTRRRATREATRTPEYSDDPVARGRGVSHRRSTLEKVRLALRGLGFRDGEARRAVAAVAGVADPNEPLTPERLLREAILVATAA